MAESEQGGKGGGGGGRDIQKQSISVIIFTQLSFIIIDHTIHNITSDTRSCGTELRKQVIMNLW